MFLSLYVFMYMTVFIAKISRFCLDWT